MELWEARNWLSARLDVKLLTDDEETWLNVVGQIPHDRYVPLSYKPMMIAYQKEYFSAVYDDYLDASFVLYRGGTPIGVFPLCLYRQEGKIKFGSLGGSIVEPLFVCRTKAETQRAVIQKILDAIFELVEEQDAFDNTLTSAITVTDNGASQWQRKWMELGARCIRTSWQAFADLFLPQEELQSRIRRTNKYSILKGQSDYDIELYDADNGELSKTFEEFHEIHRLVSGRETRGQSTWDLQEMSIRKNSAERGYDFVVFIRDTTTRELVGAALFATTPQTGTYCVAAYDRAKFSRPVGHVVQAVAMDYMRSKGIRWYEIGERVYPNDEGSYPKLVNIGKYKEGFATHFFPRIMMKLTKNDFLNRRLEFFT